MMTTFWSTHHGQSATTSNTVAVACAMAVLYPKKTLLVHTHTKRSTLEACLFPDRMMKGFDTGDFANHGMDALFRLSKNGRLTGEMVPDYTWSILKDHKLDLLPGTEKNMMPEYSDESSFSQIFRAAEAYYKQVFVDLHSGLEMKGTLVLLQEAVQNIICLNQNEHLLDLYFQDKELRAQVEKSNTLFILSRYDPEVGVTPKSISRKYKIPLSRIMTIPYNSSFMQACNHGVAYDFISRHILDGKSPEKAFMKEIQKLAEKLEEGMVS